jgi:hypothetical protein
VLVTASRSIIHAWYGSDDDRDWTRAVTTAAENFVSEIAAVVGERSA